MSISPKPTEQESFKPSAGAIIGKTASNTITGFFANPLHYIFWISLIGIIIGLFLGYQFSPILYSIVGLFGSIKLYEYFKKNN